MQRHTRVLVKWKGYDETTWEAENFLKDESGRNIAPLVFLRRLQPSALRSRSGALFFAGKSLVFADKCEKLGNSHLNLLKFELRDRQSYQGILFHSSPVVFPGPHRGSCCFFFHCVSGYQGMFSKASLV